MLNNNDVRKMAAAGCRAEIDRLNTLLQELEAPVKRQGAQKRSNGEVSKRSMNMTPEQRAAVSQRMKAFWANRRAASAAQAAEAPAGTRKRKSPKPR